MSRKKVLLTVVTYPLPSRSYDELVCTAGILETGEWIRIYPVPLSFLIGQKIEGRMHSFKYTWIELELIRRQDDFRPESYSPKYYDFRDIKLFEEISTKKNWFVRKELCLKNVYIPSTFEFGRFLHKKMVNLFVENTRQNPGYACVFLLDIHHLFKHILSANPKRPGYTNLESLIEDSKAPANKSLATFKPSSIEGLDIEDDEREWKNEWKELRKQGDLFSQDKPPESLVRKLPYKFYYRFTDDSGKSSRLMIEDWEIGQLYWKCLRSTSGNETAALEKVRQKYEEEFINKKDIYFFLGTTMNWHRRRGKNPFVIIGVFYPKKETQLKLF